MMKGASRGYYVDNDDPFTSDFYMSHGTQVAQGLLVRVGILEVGLASLGVADALASGGGAQLVAAIREIPAILRTAGALARIGGWGPALAVAAPGASGLLINAANAAGGNDMLSSVEFQEARLASEGLEVAENAAQGAAFRSFPQFKAALGPAGAGSEWHHIVEQTPGNLGRFGAGPIQNTGNLIRVEYGVHRQISGFYSSIQPISQGMTVRQWLSTQSFAAQQEYGINVLKDFGVLP